MACRRLTGIFKERLLKGKAQYSSPPSTNPFISAAFVVAYTNHFFLQNKVP